MRTAAYKGRERDRETDRETERQTERQRERQGEAETDTQRVSRLMCTYALTSSFFILLAACLSYGVFYYL